jgi:glycosyltransferase involved in cell wall biosynthesis
MRSLHRRTGEGAHHHTEASLVTVDASHAAPYDPPSKERVPLKLISVITPTRNGAAKIVATIDSVLQQDRSLFDFHVVDGGSDDGTIELVRRAAPEIQLTSEPDRGVYDAINKGVARSEGRFVYVIGAGDTLRPGIFATLAARLAAQPPNSIVYGNVRWISERRLYDGVFTRGDLTTHCICHQAMFIDRSLFESIGPYDQRYPISADWHFNIRCFADPRVRFQYVDEIIADYEGGGISDTGYDARFQADLPELIRRSFGIRSLVLLRLYRARRRLHGAVLRIRQLAGGRRRST